MKIHVYKFQGAGNDFVCIDNRKGDVKLTTKQINRLCDRRFGVGSDGMMLIGKSKKYDFSMRYFNADGREGSMCGNGGRCISAFADYLGIKKLEFEAIDGYHNAKILSRKDKQWKVRLKMSDVLSCPKFGKKSFFLDTGSPHYVEFVKDVDNYPVDTKGKYWRYYFEGGTNVNFVEVCPSILKIRTYERGVEAETFACGTGATASAIAAFTSKVKPHSSKGSSFAYKLQARGGKLEVKADYKAEDKSFREVYLTGPATLVFECDIEV
ncbi:MAG: diaminopimelate epimerase [Bacteroidales bacterium]|nr:diaminopimelate epimerase [Bacteroidales bacterium]MBP5517058.1 diaminopimelate epimerase [Bacteroidales bacterium]